MLWCALHHHIPAFKPPRRQICSGPISLPVVITRCLRLRPIQHSIRNWHQWITTVSFQSGPINPGLQLLRHLTFCLSRIFNSFGVTPQPFSIGPTDFSCSAKHRIRMFACKQKRPFAESLAISIWPFRMQAINDIVVTVNSRVRGVCNMRMVAWQVDVVMPAF